MNPKYLLIAFLMAISISTSSSANSRRIFILSADDWAQPRIGNLITELSPIRGAVNYWEKDINSAILILYPGEDSGEIWATELRDWMISLGVPSDYLILNAGSHTASEIKLIVDRYSELE